MTEVLIKGSNDQTGLFQEGEGAIRPPLDLFILNIRQTSTKTILKTQISPCWPNYVYLMCACRQTILRTGCNKLDCPACAERLGKRRSSRVRERINFGLASEKDRFKVILYTVFEVPESFHARMLDKMEWKRVKDKAWTLLKTMCGAWYGVECSHPIGDSSTERFFPHLNFLWVQRPGYKPFIPVDELRRAWQLALETYSPVDLYHSYAKQRDEKKYNHMVKYVTRVFVGFSKWIGSMRWFGHYPRNAIKKTLWCCTVCGEPFLIYGRPSDPEILEYILSLDSS